MVDTILWSCSVAPYVLDKSLLATITDSLFISIIEGFVGVGSDEI